jgi:hypothetical protein
MHADYLIFFLTALFAVVGAGLFRVGLMNFKSESPENSRKGWLFIALGIALGIAALISILRAMKMAG